MLYHFWGNVDYICKGFKKFYLFILILQKYHTDGLAGGAVATAITEVKQRWARYGWVTAVFRCQNFV